MILSASLTASKKIKIRLCGIDAPELEQTLGVSSRDHLRQLMAKGNGDIVLLPINTDRYGRTVAEAFISAGNGEEEINLNGQIVADGMAYVYPPYISDCPNGSRIK